MDDQMFFYPPYPFESGDGGEEYSVYEMRNDHALFTPKETLEYGNIFRKEYVGYKNYQPPKLNARNDREARLFDIMAMWDYCHDLKLYLDIYPNDKRMLELYRQAVKKYEESKRSEDAQLLGCPGVGPGDGRKYPEITIPAQWML